MLIHKLTKIIKQEVDDNISFVECDHPFSGKPRSQIILVFKEQKTRVSIVQISDAYNKSQRQENRGRLWRPL